MMERREKKKTGIFCGSFNPIHIGHLALANYLCEFGEVDELWFMVSPHNPLKQQHELWSDELRLKLAQLATAAYPRFHVSDFEFRLPRPSYSVNTLQQLRKAYPEREFYFIIGADNWASFGRWYQAERILQENFILVYPRPGHPIESTHLPENVRIVSSPLLDISSTFIRQALKEGKDVRYFLHPDVWEYLQTHTKHHPSTALRGGV